ncbi:UBP-type zinc finger domain-containing protein [Mycobacterium sp. C31M]
MLKRSRRRATASRCEHLLSTVESVEPAPVTPGCCDSSPYQHATAHFRQAGHPVMRSAEPGESWRWCYVDARVG